jgi:NADH-quinone oxidoreductase subunit L
MKNVTFIDLANSALLADHQSGHTGIALFIGLMLLLAAAAKSAQFPFSSWLPRAMEGPTPSSAIFYGSLSVHLGVFLLLRTFPFWENLLLVRLLIGGIGGITALLSTMIARVQTSVKTQIGYASLTQIGIMFIEVAAGFELLALVHFAGNAFLRTYQLLVSPSVVSYLIREQFYGFVPQPKKEGNSTWNRLHLSVYVWSLKEWNLDRLVNRLVFLPLKKLGHRLDFLRYRTVFVYFIPSYALGVYLLLTGYVLPEILHQVLPSVFAFIALLLVLRSFTERKSIPLAWTMLLLNHFWMVLAIAENENFSAQEIGMYLSGVLFFGIPWLGANFLDDTSSWFARIIFLPRPCQAKSFGRLPLFALRVGIDWISYFPNLHWRRPAIQPYQGRSVCASHLGCLGLCDGGNSCHSNLCPAFLWAKSRKSV